MMTESYNPSVCDPEMSEDFMEQDHVALAEIFRALDAALAGGDAARAFELLDFAWARLAVHIRAEHLRLFPAILNALAEDSGASDLVRRPSLAEAHACLERLRDDHDFFMRELAGSVNSLREMLRTASGGGEVSAEALEGVRQVITGVVARLEEHNRLEEEQVYLWPEMLLSGAAREEMRALVKLEIENLPPRFHEAATGDKSSERTERAG